MADKIPDRVTMTPVQSSQIKAIGHDAQENHLYVEFHGKPDKPRSVYRYGSIEAAHHAALLGHDESGTPKVGHSIGSHFIHNIKRNPDAHPHTRLNMEDDNADS